MAYFKSTKEERFFVSIKARMAVSAVALRERFGHFLNYMYRLIYLQSVHRKFAHRLFICILQDYLKLFYIITVFHF